MATETFTITLDSIGTTASVTINDTSQTVAGSQLLTSSGSFTVPAGVTSMTIYAVGGGAGGPPGQYSSGSGNGGGGGSYARVTGLTVQPGDVFAVSIGAGGTGGSVSTNSPFETVNGSSQKYPQSGTVTNATAGGETQVTWSRSGSDIGTIHCYGGSTNGGGGSAQADAVIITGATDYDIRVGGNGGSAGSATIPGGGGGGGYGGRGGQGLGQFHRSAGGYNYYKAASGGDGGGMRLFGGTTQGSTGTNAPALGSGPYNYTGATDGGDGGDSGGNAYGHGGGGGAGGQIRDQTIYSGGGQYRYRWFLAHSGQNGGAGAVRFVWGT